MIEYATLTDRGDRKVNEDCLGSFEGANGNIFVLCDGLGGHGAGEVASAMTVEAARVVFGSQEKLNSEDLLTDIANTAQRLLHERRLQNPNSNDCKTTLTLLHIKDNVARMAHIGDSRVYMFYKATLKTRTIDHSVPQMLVLQGEIKEKDIRFHEDRNRLVRVIGDDSDQPRLALSEPIPLKPRSRFLLCSDGFWEWIVEKDMSQLLKSSKTPAEWLAKMSEVVQQNGNGKNMDNFSAVAVFVD